MGYHISFLPHFYDFLQVAIEDDIICEEIFVFSDVNDRHDNGFVKKVEEIIDKHLADRGSTPLVKHQATDGCAAQYKSRYTTHDISCFTATVHRDYYPTAHAKGPQDAAGGLVKRMADMAVIRRQAVIQNALDLQQFCIENLSQPREGSRVHRRYFHVVTAEEIPPKGCDVPVGPLKGIQSLHQISSVGQPGTVETRKLCCYTCDNCFEGRYSECTNDDICGPVKRVTLTSNEDTTEDVDEEEFSIAEAVKEKDVVQIRRHTDNNTESELVRVSKPLYKLTRECYDDRQDHYPKGTMILRGQTLKKTGISGQNHIFQATSTKIMFLGSSIISPVDVTCEGRKILIGNYEALRLSIQ